ncbi:hypothetical protein IWW50_004521 [Coemansia erecta]|nr:hypothetical protein IWW50_004521 [Coemansia erecta]
MDGQTEALVSDEQTEALLRIGQDISAVLADAKISIEYVKYFEAHAAREAEATPSKLPHWPEPVSRVFQGLQALNIHARARIYHVASTYYSWPLYERALCMAAPSPAHLCKLVVLENKRWRASTTNTPAQHANARHYAVLVQYVQTVSTSALTDFVRSLDGGSVARKHFNFRLASADVSWELTGYGKNGVSPIAMARDVPVVMSAAITRLQPPVFWLGAGHVDFKLALPVQAFVDATQCMVAEVSEPVIS